MTDPRELLCALLADFHARGWATGTGGGICGPADDATLWVAPTGVHKELVAPEDLFQIRIEDGWTAHAPQDLTPSECTPIFTAICRATGARSVVHSHALSAVLVADLQRTGVVEISGFEMLKGFGRSNRETIAVPVVGNTEREHELTGSIEALLAQGPLDAPIILVADHGAYIWGPGIFEAKKHAEVAHWLFDGILARHRTHPTGG